MKKQSNNKANVFTIDINQMIKQNIEESQKNNKPKRTPTPCIQRNKIIYPKKGFYSKRFHTEENGIVIVNKGTNDCIKKVKTCKDCNGRDTKNSPKKIGNPYQPMITQCSKVSKNKVFQTKLKYSDLWDLINISKNRIKTEAKDKNEIEYIAVKTEPKKEEETTNNRINTNTVTSIDYSIKYKIDESKLKTKKQRITSYYINKKNEMLYLVLGDELEKYIKKAII